MTKKHITAPLSYDPGKGRPKEYLAYLNWQEMQALQRLNGGNMERGPRGLPSFPPADAIGSNQTPGTGNWTGAPGSGTTSTGAGSSTGGGSDSGNVSGGMTSATSATSTSATNTADSSDTDAQQAAAVNNAISAANNQALNQDASRGGISSIPVGPQQTPVKIGGGHISGTIAGLSRTVSSPAPVQSASAAEEAVRRAFAQSNLGGMYSDPNIKTELRNALSQSMWDTRIKDATRVAMGQSPKGQFGEISPTHDLAGFRTLAEQKSLSDYSRITDPKRGYHTWGMAADVGPTRLQGEDFDSYMGRIRQVNEEISQNITDDNVAWGGDIFKKFDDPGHFQYGTGPVSRSIARYGATTSQAGVPSFARNSMSTGVGDDQAVRTLESITNTLNQRFGTNYSADEVSNLARAIAGEAAGEDTFGQAAVANTMINRIAAAQVDPEKYGYMGGSSINRLMSQYDATGMRPGTQQNKPYQAAEPGTATYEAGLSALSEALNPESEFSKIASARVLNATHYYNPDSANPKWGTSSGREFEAVGRHVFGNAEPIESAISTARFPDAPVTVSPEKQLADVERSYNPSITSDPIAEAAIRGIANLPGALDNFRIPSIPEGSSAQKNALSLAKAVMPESAYQGMVNKAVADAVAQSGFSLAGSFASGIGALRNAMEAPTAVAGKSYQDRLMTIDGITREVPAENFERMSPEDQARINEYQQAQRYDPNFSGPYGAVPNGNVADSGAPETVNPDDFVGPTYVTTDIQKIMEDQERKNRMGSQVIKRGAPFVGTGLSIAEGIQKLFTGKDIADYGTDLKNRYMQEGPEGRAALRAKYPDMRRFAVSIGDIPPNTGTQFASSGDLSRELGGKDNRQNYYMDQVAYSPPVYSGATKEPAMETGRPYKHYLWDLGVDVPSPGDPDYNDYVKYLKKRDNSSDV